MKNFTIQRQNKHYDKFVFSAIVSISLKTSLREEALSFFEALGVDFGLIFSYTNIGQDLNEFQTENYHKNIFQTVIHKIIARESVFITFVRDDSFYTLFKTQIRLCIFQTFQCRQVGNHTKKIII